MSARGVARSLAGGRSARGVARSLDEAWPGCRASRCLERVVVCGGRRARGCG